MFAWPVLFSPAVFSSEPSHGINHPAIIYALLALYFAAAILFIISIFRPR